MLSAFSQAALICRAVVNGEDELIFGSYFNSSFNDYWRVYEGAGRVKELSLYTHDVRYLSDGWTYNASNPNEFARFVGTLEDTFVDENGGDFDRSTPSQTITSTGVVRSHGYSSAGFIGTTTYSDATTEKYQYSTAQQGGNQFNLVTRYKDRIGRVTKNTYDSVGNLTLREVGIREVGGADVNQPEYATYQNAYYDGTEGPAIVTGDAGVDAAAVDPQPEHLLKSSTDANGNVTFRLYDVNLQLIAVVEPDDTGAGHHIAMKFTYDSARRQKTSTDAVGREMEYFYDDRDRAIMVRYTDGSTERTLFGDDAGQTQNLVVATQDRDGTVTSFEYDDQGRLEKTITASHKIPTADVIDETKTDLGALLAGNEITDVNVKVERTCTYLDGTGLLASCTDRGETTSYEYDYRQRRIERTVQPRSGQTLTSKTVYIDNLVFSTEDPYGRKSFNAYRASDSALIRSVQATLPGPAGEPADFADVLALTRSGTPSAPDVNGEYLITDSELDAAGQQFATIDPRGVVHATEFDSRGRTVKSVEAATDAASYDPADFEDGIVETALAAIAAKTETDYDAQSNVTEVRHPRFFDTTDTEGENTCKTVRTYTRRNLTETETVAAGADAYVAGDPLKVKVTRSFTYRLDRTADTTTDFRGEDWATLWHLCCQRAIVAIDPTATVDDSGTDKQAGGVTFYSGYGDVTHTGTIVDFANFTAPTGEINDASYNTDLTDADTLRESTTRYDARHRPTHQTVWLVPAYEQGGTGAINPQNPPIVGGGDTIDPPLEVTSVKQGLTTRWLYDENLTDGVGLDSAAGVSVPNLSGTGSFNVSIADLLTELTADGTSFAAGSDGYAVVVINPEQELSVSISDGAGRAVASAMLDPLDQASPVTAPITWNTVQHDAVTTVTGFGDVLETANHDALDHVTKSRTDGAGRALESEDALGNVTEIGYNENGATVSVLDPNEVGWDAGTALGTFDGYDARNRLTDRIDTNGDTSSSVYDKNNNVTLTTDAKSQNVVCRFDARDRKYSCVDRVSSDTRLRYDQNSNLTIQKDGEDQQTEYMYDERNLKVLSQFPDHVVGQNPGDANYGITTCTYDAAKRKFRYEDQLGDTKTHIYDMADRLKQRDYRLRVNSPSGTIADSDVMTYDDSSRVLTAVSERYSNTVTLTYDDANRKATEKLTILSKNFKVTSTYDAANRRTQIKYPDNVLVDREYTDRDQLEFVKYTNTAAGGTLTNFILDKRTYDDGMRLEKCEQNFSGAGSTPRVTTDVTFRGNPSDPGDDLIESITRTGLTGADYTYSYDANKNKLKETINAPLANYGYGTTVGQEAAYDAEDRLTNWHRDDTLRDLNWVITKVGDFSSYSVEGVAETRTHGNSHELNAITGGGFPGTLAYDAKGNLTTRSDNFSFVWDFDNQLKEVTVPAGSALGVVGTHKYSYDALGRRVLKHVAGEKRLIFVHDGDQIIAEYKYTNGVVQTPGPGVLEDASNSTSSQTQDTAAVIIGTRRGSATIQRKYMYTSYIDDRCLMVDRTALGASPAGTEELFYYHANNLYSVGAMTDAAGAVTERYAYDAYGQIVFLNAAGAPLATQASTIGQPYTYTGRRLDEETFLNHYRARYYDAFIIQRFIGRDPILYGDGYNMYQYVGGGPLDGLDPTGLQADSVSQAIRCCMGMPTFAAKLACLQPLLAGSPAAVAAYRNINKIKHIWEKPAHALGPVINAFGSPAAAHRALMRALNAKHAAGRINIWNTATGEFVTSLRLGGQTVTVRGVIVDGAIKIGSAFRPIGQTLP